MVFNVSSESQVLRKLLVSGTNGRSFSIGLDEAHCQMLYTSWKTGPTSFPFSASCKREMQCLLDFPLTHAYIYRKLPHQYVIIYVACWYFPSDVDLNREWQAARREAQLHDQKQAILGHTAAMNRVTDFSGVPAGVPTVSWDHDIILMCCITYTVKNGTTISGIGYRKSLVVTWWAISLLLCTNGHREQCVLTCLVCCVSNFTACMIIL